MKKSVKKNQKPPPKKGRSQKPAPAAPPAESSAIVKPSPMERARERVETARKAALNKAISQLPD
jgi:hypothetical protein